MVKKGQLSKSYQAVQGSHAALQFYHEYPSQARDWYTNSNHLIFLEIKDDIDLYRLIDKLDRNGTDFSVFKEPDLDDEITAISFIQNEQNKKLVSNLKLL